MASADQDVAQMQEQIKQYGSVTQFGIRVTEINGPTHTEGSTGSITQASGGVVSGSGGQYNAGWEIGNWGNTLTFTQR